MESCSLDFWLTFLLQIFYKKCFCSKNISEIVRPFLATLSVNGLRVAADIVVWTYDTFDDKFEIEIDFWKYLKESY